MLRISKTPTSWSSRVSTAARIRRGDASRRSVNNGLCAWPSGRVARISTSRSFIGAPCSSALPLRSTSPAFVTPELIIGAERAGFRVRRDRRSSSEGESRASAISAARRTSSGRSATCSAARSHAPVRLAAMSASAEPTDRRSRWRSRTSTSASGSCSCRGARLALGRRRGRGSQEFEQRFALRVGAQHAVATSSCTTASLPRAARARHRSRRRGDRPLTVVHRDRERRACTAAPSRFSQTCEARPTTSIPSRSRPRSDRARAPCSSSTRSGCRPISPASRQVARRRGLAVVEDAACAIGARHAARTALRGRSRQLGHLALLQLPPAQGPVHRRGRHDHDPRRRARRDGCAGSATRGCTISDLERHRSAAPVTESYPEVGYNFRMSDLHAAVGVAQLEKLDPFLARRRELAARYDRALAGFPESEPPWAPKGAEPNHQSYIVRVRGADAERRDRVIDELQRRGVATRRGLMASHLEACHRGRARRRIACPRRSARRRRPCCCRSSTSSRRTTRTS